MSKTLSPETTARLRGYLDSLMNQWAPSRRDGGADYCRCAFCSARGHAGTNLKHDDDCLGVQLEKELNEEG